MYYYLGKAMPQKGFNFLLLKRVESDINFLFSLQHGKRIAFWQIYPCILNVPITLYACFQTLLSKKPNKTLKVFTHFVFVVKSQPGFFYFKGANVNVKRSQLHLLSLNSYLNLLFVNYKINILQKTLLLCLITSSSTGTFFIDIVIFNQTWNHRCLSIG